MNNIPYEQIARYLAGECNDKEKKQIREWIRENPETMDELTRIWENTPQNSFTPDVEQALQNVHRSIDTRKKNRSRRLFILISSAAAILIIVGLFGIRSLNTSEEDKTRTFLTLSTNANERKGFLLPDGSNIWLNASSTLRYPEEFEGDTREVYLEGEAFFDITSNSDKPFIIMANNTVTQVVGTSFSIRAVKKEPEVVVTVATGIVNFSAGDENHHIVLRQGEQGICKELKLEKKLNHDPNVFAWRTHVMAFRDTPLKDVAKIIESTYRIPVTVDKSIAELEITTTFNKLQLQEVVNIIEMTLQVNAEITKDGVLFK